MGFADALHVVAQASAVEVGVVAAEGDAVGDAVCLEGDGFDAAEFDGVVDEFAVGSRLKGVCADGGQGGGGLPVFGQVLQDEGLGFVQTAFEGEKEAGTVEEAAFGGEVGGAHGQVVGVDGVADAPLALEGFGLPGVFGGLPQGGGAAVVFGVYFDDVAGEIADGVAAGHPVGEF